MPATNLIDFYKTGHRIQYPSGTSLVYSNWTPRKSRDENTHVINFGLQYFIKEYLIKQWNETFFYQQKRSIVNKYRRRLDNSLGKGAVSIEHINALHDLGYLPIKIKSLPEGTKCPIGVPMTTIYNTLPDFFWLTNYLETILSCIYWMPCTSATKAAQFKQIFLEYAKKTHPENIGFVDWQGHDFSMRGMAGLEAAVLSGAAHLLSFTGTDTVPAIDFLEDYYGADSDKEMIGGSVAATEHSCMCLGTKSEEFSTFERLIKDIYPSGILSIVSDTWDLWKVLTDYLPRLKDDIKNRSGKIVIRPDSGDPVKIVCGDPHGKTPEEKKGVIQLLWDVFGGATSSTGYKILNNVGCIYGDGINIERAKAICEQLANNGFASTNMVFGIGSYTYQYTTRDQYGFALKSTYGEVNGDGRDIWKDPVTDDGLKKSAKGLLKVQDLVLTDECSWSEESSGQLQTVFEDGKLLIDQSLKEIRNRVNKDYGNL